MLDASRRGGNGMDVVVAASPPNLEEPVRFGQFHRIHLPSGESEEPVPVSEAMKLNGNMLSIADVDGDRQRDFVLGENTYSGSGFESGRVLLLSSRTGSILRSWELPPVGKHTPHHIFGESLQSFQSHATDSLFLADARCFPGGDAKRGVIALLDSRTDGVLARIEGKDAVAEAGLNLLQLDDPLDLDEDRLFEFATLRPLGSSSTNRNPGCVLEIWSGSEMLQLQGAPAISLGEPDVQPMHRFHFDHSINIASAGWLPDCNGDGQPDLFVVFLPDRGTVSGVHTVVALSMTRGVVWEKKFLLASERTMALQERHVHMGCSVEDLDGDGMTDLALFIVDPRGKWLLFVSAADGRPIGEFAVPSQLRGDAAMTEAETSRMLHVPDLDGDGFGQLLVPRVQQGPDGQPQCTLMLYDLKRLR